MYLMGLLEFNEDVGGYIPVGEQEFDEQMQRKMLSSNMKMVRRIMLETLPNGTGDFQPKMTTPLVKTLTLLAHGYSAFQEPVVNGNHMDNFGAFCEHWFTQTDPALRNPMDD